jgi:hypothetical protein
MSFRLRVATIAAVLALTPGLALSEEAIDPSTPELKPAELKAALTASRIVLGVQREEREIAKEAGLDGLAEEIEELRGSVERFARSQRVDASGAPSSATALRKTVLDDVSRLANKRSEVAKRAASLKSPAQRGIAKRAAARLAEVEREVREALDAPAAQRGGRMAAVGRRLSIERHGAGTEADAPPTPTLLILPASELHPIQPLDPQ